jgi:uncharacterized protein YqfB (UPF0267 family)
MDYKTTTIKSVSIFANQINHDLLQALADNQSYVSASDYEPSHIYSLDDLENLKAELQEDARNTELAELRKVLDVLYKEKAQQLIII